MTCCPANARGCSDPWALLSGSEKQPLSESAVPLEQTLCCPFYHTVSPLSLCNTERAGEKSNRSESERCQAEALEGKVVCVLPSAAEFTASPGAGVSPFSFL